ncbi:MAG: cell division protein ZapA [Acidobacteriaceae bacterium]|nr:cell division protein ZapA [Acidobacteriaceae bacterium]MBV8570323.1 cell division protein ZapA [Acidobacteriaceae bacterium]
MHTPDGPKQVVRVTIFNQSYSVSTSGDPVDTEKLAQEVDDLMSSIARRAGNLDSTRTAVLACLHLADRLRATEQAMNELRQSIDRKTRSFMLLLDQAFEDQQPR